MEHKDFVDMTPKEVSAFLRQIADDMDAGYIFEGYVNFNIDPDASGLAVSAALRFESSVVFYPSIKVDTTHPQDVKE